MTDPKPRIFFMPPADPLPGSPCARSEPAPVRAPQPPPPILPPDVQLSEDIAREVAALAAVRAPRPRRLQLFFLRSRRSN